MENIRVPNFHEIKRMELSTKEPAPTEGSNASAQKSRFECPKIINVICPGNISNRI